MERERGRKQYRLSWEPEVLGSWRPPAGFQSFVDELLAQRAHLCRQAEEATLWHVRLVWDGPFNGKQAKHWPKQPNFTEVI